MKLSSATTLLISFSSLLILICVFVDRFVHPDPERFIVFISEAGARFPGSIPFQIALIPVSFCIPVLCALYCHLEQKKRLLEKQSVLFHSIKLLSIISASGLLLLTVVPISIMFSLHVYGAQIFFVSQLCNVILITIDSHSVKSKRCSPRFWLNYRLTILLILIVCIPTYLTFTFTQYLVPGAIFQYFSVLSLLLFFISLRHEFGDVSFALSSF
ncbi:hypothetical protein RCL1_004131 [Eukaryota sp. TZLM3-RCL]